VSISTVSGNLILSRLLETDSLSHNQLHVNQRDEQGTGLVKKAHTLSLGTTAPSTAVSKRSESVSGISTAMVATPAWRNDEVGFRNRIAPIHTAGHG
jgi:hypothetical protein